MPGPLITAAAQKFMRRIVRFGGLGEAAGFRLTVIAGGCSGYDASFTVAAAPEPGDERISLDGLQVFLPAPSAALLDGVTVDFADTMASTGLTFFNPAGAPRSCSSGAPSLPPGIAKVNLDALRRRHG